MLKDYSALPFSPSPPFGLVFHILLPFFRSSPTTECRTFAIGVSVACRGAISARCSKSELRGSVESSAASATVSELASKVSPAGPVRHGRYSPQLLPQRCARGPNSPNWKQHLETGRLQGGYKHIVSTL
jgi:hypothetical protein